MAFDGFTAAALAAELGDKLAGGRVDKIAQPERDDVVLTVRNKGENHKLLLTASATAPRAHLTNIERPGPPAAPLFCMVLRKHIAGGKLLRVEQPGFDRVLRFVIESADEMGELSEKSLIIEMMGRHSNIILVDHRGFILDSARRVPRQLSSVREVLPGLRFEPPPNRGKLNPLEADDLGYAPFGERFNGIGAGTEKEVITRAERNGTSAAAELAALLDDARAGSFDALAVTDGGKAADFFCCDTAQYPEERKRRFASVSELLEFFYAAKDAGAKVASKTQDLRRLVSGNIDRCLKKREIQARTIADAEGRETLRVFGELLTANLYNIEPGQDRFTCENFYNGETVTIPLEPRKTPNENAQAYFKKYGKQKRAREAAITQAALNEGELAYLETVLASILSCETEADIADVRAELAEQGYVKRRSVKADKRAKPSKPLTFAVNGRELLVGKNNRQNDELTMKTAAADDLWFHTKDIPGSHVILRLDGGQAAEGELAFAANLAAWFSKARDGSNVPVDYTRRRFVKKPGGAKPGFVVYTNQKTVYVTPIEPS